MGMVNYKIEFEANTNMLSVTIGLLSTLKALYSRGDSLNSYKSGTTA